jgi:NADH-quinone oxidoreductase subunit L
VAVISTVLALAALAAAYLLYARRYREHLKLPIQKRPVDPLIGIVGPFFKVMANKFYVDEIYHALVVNPYNRVSAFLADVIDWRFLHDWFHDRVIVGGFNRLSAFLANPVDMGVIDGAANGLGRLAQGAAAVLRTTQTGYVRTYALSVFLGVVIILGILIIW